MAYIVYPKIKPSVQNLSLLLLKNLLLRSDKNLMAIISKNKNKKALLEKVSAKNLPVRLEPFFKGGRILYSITKNRNQSRLYWNISRIISGVRDLKQNYMVKFSNELDTRAHSTQIRRKYIETLLDARLNLRPARKFYKRKKKKKLIARLRETMSNTTLPLFKKMRTIRYLLYRLQRRIKKKKLKSLRKLSLRKYRKRKSKKTAKYRRRKFLLKNFFYMRKHIKFKKVYNKTLLEKKPKFLSILKLKRKFSLWKPLKLKAFILYIVKLRLLTVYLHEKFDKEKNSKPLYKYFRYLVTIFGLKDITIVAARKNYSLKRFYIELLAPNDKFFPKTAGIGNFFKLRQNKKRHILNNSTRKSNFIKRLNARYNKYTAEKPKN